MFKEVIIVEGKNDYNKLISIFKDIDVIITNGSAISNLEQIKEVSLKRDIILFLDPDFPGEKIRNAITEIIPNAKHAFLPRSQAHSKNNKKIGIEHASTEDIIIALERVLTPNLSNHLIKQNDLYELGLIGKDNSSQLREKLDEKLHIGKTNSKTLLKRLNIFNISIDEIKEAIL